MSDLLIFSAEMIRFYLLAVAGSAVANMDPSDVADPCSLGDCPAGWQKVEDDDCVMFAGWEERRGREMCRLHRAELVEWSSRVWLCRVGRVSQCQCGRHYRPVQSLGAVNMGQPWQGTVQHQKLTITQRLYIYSSFDN